MQKEITDTMSLQAGGDHQIEEQIFAIPDIKLSHSGYLIYANARGIDFLRKVSENKKTPSVGFLVSEFPVILIPGCKTTLHLNVGEDLYNIRVAASLQTGQVGLYISKQLLSGVSGKTAHSS
jgi:hypothetical protein